MGGEQVGLVSARLGESRPELFEFVLRLRRTRSWGVAFCNSISSPCLEVPATRSAYHRSCNLSELPLRGDRRVLSPGLFFGISRLSDSDLCLMFVQAQMYA